MYNIERYHDISCGHRVHGHESKCAHLHGHNYRITFKCVPDPGAGVKPVQRSFIGTTPVNEIASPLDEVGRVADFSIVKSELCMWVEDHWDHKFLIWDQDPMAAYLVGIDPLGVVKVPFNPTAENMAQFLVETVGPEALRGTGVVLLGVTVWETAKCCATFEVSQ